MRRLTFVVAMVVGLAGVAKAQAPAGPDATDADPNAVEARAQFERGRELAEARRFSEAVQAFTRSLELVDRPSTVLNLAICLFALERYVEAIDALERYEAGADPSVEADGLADARRMLTHARAAVARVVIEVAPVEAIVTVDGDPVGGSATRERAVNPGPHVVRVEAAHHAPALIELDAAPGATVRRAIALESTQRPARLEVRAMGRPDARILVDAQAVGVGSAVTELPAGAHEVRVLLTDSDAVAHRVELEWNEHLRLDLPAPPPETPLVERPELWAIVGGTVAGIAVGVLIGVLAAGVDAQPDGGTSGEVLRLDGGHGGVSLP